MNQSFSASFYDDIFSGISPRPYFPGSKMPLLPDQWEWIVYYYNKHKELSHLDLSNYRIHEIPEIVSHLRHIKSLDLRGNYISSLPDSFAKLKRLQCIYLSRNSFTAFPEILLKIGKLREIYLEKNAIEELPEAISCLKQLQVLDFSENSLTGLPESLGKLQKLTSIYLSSNGITELPLGLGLLKRLGRLEVDLNPLLSPPPEVVQQGAESILAFLRDQQEKRNQVQVWRSKLVIAGEAGVGKSNLLRRLKGEAFDDDLTTTPFLDVGVLKLKHPDKQDVEMVLNTWDFGGQEIYHATHQFFLTNRSLYLLLWNARLGYQQGKIEYWLDAIKSRAPESSIIIVATHIDEREALLPIEELKRNYAQILGFWPVSNKSGVGIDELRNAVTKAAADQRNLPLMGEVWPLTWHAAAEGIRSLKDKFITADQVTDLLSEYNVNGVSRDTLLGWLHMLGEILYFPNDHELKNAIILQPQWVTNHLSRVLDSEEVSKGLGLLRRSTMEELWCDLSYEMREHFLRLMEKYDLSYQTLNNHEISIVVERLSYNEDHDIESLWAEVAARWPHRQVTILFKLQGNLPPGIPTWFIARQHRFSIHKHWRFGALLADDPKNPTHLALIRANASKRTIELSVRGPAPHNFFALLKDGFEITLARFPGLEIERLVPCAGHGDSTCNHLFKLQQLEKRMLLDPPKFLIECPEATDLVDVRKMLYGVSNSVHSDALEKMDARLSELVKSNKEHYQEVKMMLVEQTILVQREFLALYRRDQNSADSLCPRVFTLCTEAQNALFKVSSGQTVTLQLYCEEPGCWHSTGAAGRYRLKLPPGWLELMAPYISKLVRLLKFVTPLVSGGLGVSVPEFSAQLKAELEFTKALIEKLPTVAPSSNAPTLTVEQKPIAREIDNAEIRSLEQMLISVDAKKVWGNLQRTITPEGHCFWLCDEHAKVYRQ